MKLILTAVIVGSVLRTGAVAEQPAVTRNVETIQVVRSVRLVRVEPTQYCAQRHTGFPNPTFEDRYDFRAVVTRASDGVVTNAAGPTVGNLHACFGATDDPLTFSFYAEGELNGVRLTGRGDCRSADHEAPEAGITPWRCYLDLSELSAGFVAGQLTTNTVVSRKSVGETSDPVGYAQPSIATVRLWRRR